MRVKLINQEKDEIEAEILEGKNIKLPSIQDGWRFNFKKHSKATDVYTYALTSIESPDVIEGCLMYKMLDKNQPDMAFIEVAPHNSVSTKKYDFFAGCLIAYACRLSFIHGQGDFKGWLAFDVQEEDKKEEEKLMRLYSSKYRAKRFDKTTTMLIMPEDGEALIRLYLN
jgi:hypothetical protein